MDLWKCQNHSDSALVGSLCRHCKWVSGWHLSYGAFIYLAHFIPGILHRNIIFESAEHNEIVMSHLKRHELNEWEMNDCPPPPRGHHSWGGGQWQQEANFLSNIIEKVSVSTCWGSYRCERPTLPNSTGTAGKNTSSAFAQTWIDKNNRNQIKDYC